MARIDILNWPTPCLCSYPPTNGIDQSFQHDYPMSNSLIDFIGTHCTIFVILVGIIWRWLPVASCCFGIVCERLLSIVDLLLIGIVIEFGLAVRMSIYTHYKWVSSLLTLFTSISFILVYFHLTWILHYLSISISIFIFISLSTSTSLSPSPSTSTDLALYCWVQ